MKITEKENIEELLIGNLKMVRKGNGYRHAIDPFLLCAFGTVEKNGSVVDLGTATGIIPMVLAATTDAIKITGVEIQPGLAAQARDNVELNQLQSRVQIMQTDVRAIQPERVFPPESYDVVFSNPPYRKTATGKISPESERALCRHEIHGGLEDFISAAFFLLRNKGRCNFIYLPERMPELLLTMHDSKLEPKRLRCIHSRAGSPAVMIMVEGMKNSKPGLKVEPPLYIYAGDEYSGEIKKIFQMGEK